MQNLRLGIVATVLAALLSGCGDEVPRPSSEPASAPQLDEMKSQLLDPTKAKAPKKPARPKK